MPTEPGALPLDWAGERLLLDAQRALVWPAQATVVVADLHLGKDGAFRRAGLALPVGTMHADLARLAGLVQRHAARRLLVLGDFLHTTPAPDDPLLAALADWRASHPGLRIEVVVGNHDRAAAHAPLSQLVEWLGESSREGPFHWTHAPAPVTDGWMVCGHLHPMLRLGRGPDRVRVPVFVLEPRQLLLPAFGEFTGGVRPPLGPDSRLYAIADGAVVALPASTVASRSC